MADIPASGKSRHQDGYPEPFVVPPLSLPHTQIFILPHGRGSNGRDFGTALLRCPIPVYESLQKAFPHARFVFPTASFRRATIYKRTYITQWFDNWHLSEPTKREELQIEGLKASCT